ncbi:peptide L [Staphylococcus aureus 04-02981]|nr:peptide L [Staphylococcus aureus 04-02981]
MSFTCFLEVIKFCVSLGFFWFIITFSLLVHYNLLLTGYNELTLSVHYNQLILIWLITNFINNKYRKSTHTFISFPFFSL